MNKRTFSQIRDGIIYRIKRQQKQRYFAQQRAKMLQSQKTNSQSYWIELHQKMNQEHQKQQFLHKILPTINQCSAQWFFDHGLMSFLIQMLHQDQYVRQVLQIVCRLLCLSHQLVFHYIDGGIVYYLVLYLKRTQISQFCIFAIFKLAQNQQNCKNMLQNNMHNILIEEFNYRIKFCKDDFENDKNISNYIQIIKILQKLLSFKDNSQKYKPQTNQILNFISMLISNNMLLKQSLETIYQSFLSQRLKNYNIEPCLKYVVDIFNQSQSYQYCLYNLIYVMLPKSIDYTKVIQIGLKSFRSRMILQKILEKLAQYYPFIIKDLDFQVKQKILDSFVGKKDCLITAYLSSQENKIFD